MRNKKLLLICIFYGVLMGGCAQMSQLDMGNVGAKTVATGAAAGGESQGGNSKLEHCDSPLGTISLVENQAAGWYTALTGQYHLPPTSSLLRLMVQQSNCFVVVERSAAGMSAMQRERALMTGGQMRQGSQMDGGQMVASDYAMSPEVIFNDGNTGGASGGVGGRMGGGIFGAVAAVAASVKTSEASVMLTLVDNRSGVQVSASEGSAKNTDFAGMGALLGSSAGGTFGAYSKTPQGKVIAASFMDAYNNMVKALRNYKAQVVRGQGLGGGGRLGVDGGAAPSQTRARQQSTK